METPVFQHRFCAIRDISQLVSHTWRCCIVEFLGWLPSRHCVDRAGWTQEAACVRDDTNADRLLHLHPDGQERRWYPALGGIWRNVPYLRCLRLELAASVSSELQDPRQKLTCCRPWCLGPELVPVRYRHVGNALNAFSNWTFTFIIGKLEYLTSAIGRA